MSDRTVDYSRFDTGQEGLRAPLYTLGNGYFPNLSFFQCRVHHPGIYCQGLFPLMQHTFGREPAELSP